MLTDLAAMSRKDKRKRKQIMLKHMHVDDGLGNLPTTWGGPFWVPKHYRSSRKSLITIQDRTDLTGSCSQPYLRCKKYGSIYYWTTYEFLSVTQKPPMYRCIKH